MIKQFKRISYGQGMLCQKRWKQPGCYYCMDKFSN